MSREWKTIIVSSRSHTNTLCRTKEGTRRQGAYVHPFQPVCALMINWTGRRGVLSPWVFFWPLTSRSLSGGGEGLFLRPLPRDLDPPLRQARSSSSLMGVEGLCTVSNSPEIACKHIRDVTNGHMCVSELHRRSQTVFRRITASVMRRFERIPQVLQSIHSGKSDNSHLEQ